MFSSFDDAVKFVNADNLADYCYPFRILIALDSSGELLEMITDGSLNRESILMEIVLQEKV